MTIDEATQILNIKKGAFKEESELQRMLKVCPSYHYIILLLSCCSSATSRS